MNTSSINEYKELCRKRLKIIRENAGRRLKHLPSLPVPPKPNPPMGWELYDESGDYFGFTKDEKEKNEYLQTNKKRTAKQVVSIR